MRIVAFSGAVFLCTTALVAAQAPSPGPLSSQGFQQFQQLLAPPTTPNRPSVFDLPGLVSDPVPRRPCTVLAAFDGVLPVEISSSLRPGHPAPLLPCTVEVLKDEPQRFAAIDGLQRFFQWSQVALDVTALDHAPPSTRSAPKPALQHLGPHRASRAMAIVHIAMFDAFNEALNALGQRSLYASFTLRPIPFPTPADKAEYLSDAIAAAGFTALCNLYPAQAADLRKLYDLRERGPEMPDGLERQSPGLPCDIGSVGMRMGENVGVAIAGDLLRDRSSDNANFPEPDVGDDDGFPEENAAGRWRPDPISQIRVALGGRWNRVTPFTIKKLETFRPPPPPPPPPTDDSYVRDYNEVKELGSLTSLRRTDQETFIGRFWAYDGTALLCAPTRLYNQIARTLLLDPRVLGKRGTINAQRRRGAAAAMDRADPGKAAEPPPSEAQLAEQGLARKGFSAIEIARIMALVNIAMADAGISAWDAKWLYRYWRPITGIRAGGTDGESRTQPDYNWSPLGAPATNSGQMPNFTPPFPAYPSGHAVFGGAIFQVMRHVFDEETAFTFVSDEYNGFATGFGETQPRPRLPQSFLSLSQPEYDNARSRVFLGVHWQFDADAGIGQGRQIGTYVFNNALGCLDEKGAKADCEVLTGLARPPETAPEIAVGQPTSILSSLPPPTSAQSAVTTRLLSLQRVGRQN